MINGDLLKDVEYFRLTAAAEQLQCSIHDLLHLGAIGKIEIIAPVLLSGPYEWPISAIGEAYPQMEPAFRSSFSLHDRVALLAEDLKKIEAIGWATPRAFFAPSRGMEIATYWRGDEILQKMSYDQSITEDMVILQKIYQSDLSLDETEPARTQEEFPEFFARMEECAISIPWYAAGPMPEWGNPQEEDQGSSEAKQDGIQQDAVPLRTTIEHLFISKKEMDRLVTSAPQDSIALKRIDLHLLP